MRISPLLMAAATAAALAAPAGAVGYCTDTVGASATCTPDPLCLPGERVTVRVTGNGAGIARCGSTLTVFCEGFNCTASATATFTGRLTCSIDPIGTGTATATCSSAPPVDR